MPIDNTTSSVLLGHIPFQVSLNGLKCLGIYASLKFEEMIKMTVASGKQNKNRPSKMRPLAISFLGQVAIIKMNILQRLLTEFFFQ